MARGRSGDGDGPLTPPTAGTRAAARSFLPKFSPPRRRRDTIRRERLHRLLGDAIDYEVVVVSAPAGYGKSTLAVDWAQDADLPVAWLSLDREDTDPLTLVTNIAAAIRTVHPTALHTLAQQLEAGATPAGAPGLMGQLAAEVYRDIEDPFLLVLDDVHALEGVTDTLAALDTLVRSVPLGMHLHLLTRSWPELPSLARMTAQRRAFTISASDLQFTDDEAMTFLAGCGISDALAQAELIRRADGWAAALAILADHYDRARGAHAGVAPGSAFVLSDFIEQEVLGRLPPRALALLAAACVLPSFDAVVLAELTGDGDAPALLRELENTNHLLSELADGWYGMHALLREHLLGRLRHDEPERLLQLRRSAAAICARRGQRRQAIELSIDAGDWAEVVPELHELRESLFQRGEWVTLAGWLERLPPEVLAAEPDLAMARARLTTRMLQGQAGLAALDAIDVRRLSADQRCRRELYRSVALRQVGRLSEAIAACRRARQLGAEELPDDAPVFAEVDLEEAVALGQGGQFAAARERFQSAAEQFEQHGDQMRAAEAHDGLGAALFHLGTLAESMGEFTAALRRWRMLSEPQSQLRTMNNIGNVQHMLGELETARDTFTEVIQRAHEIGQRRYEAYGREGLAAVERDVGNLEGAEALYTLALHEAHEIDDPMLVATATGGLAMAHRDRGQYARAHTLLEHGLRSAEQHDALYLQAQFRIGIGATLLSEHRYAEAGASLERAVAAAEETGAQREEALGRLLLAAAHYHRRRRTQAVEQLERVQEIAQALGHDQFLHTEARQLPELIEFAASRRVGGEYFRALRTRLRVPEASAPLADAADEGAPIRVEAFGQPRVTVRGHPVADREWRSERSKEMFLYLLHSQRAVRKEQIALELWPELSPERLNSAFHSTLHRLRRAIDPQVVVQTDDGYQVNPAFDIAYDAREFEQHTRSADQARASSSEWAEHLGAAARLYRGPFAESFDSEWVSEARRRYEDRYLACLLALTAYALRSKQYEEAITLADSVLEVDPLNEEAVQYLMQAHARGGHLDLAARAYRRFHSAIVEELGDEPSDALRAVYQQVLSGALLDAG